MDFKIKIKKTVESEMIIKANNKQELAELIEFGLKQNAYNFDENNYTFEIEYL